MAAAPTLPAPSRPPTAKVRGSVTSRVFRWKVWAPVVYGGAGTVVAILVLFELGTLGLYRLPFALHVLSPLVSGFYTSLEIVAVVIPLGFGLGFLIGWARTTRFRGLRGLGSVYVDFFRSMPPIALIFFSATVGAIALKGVVPNPVLLHNIALWIGVIALALHTAAYQAEIVRAGILSVPAGQTEAADAVGLPRSRSMFVVVLPQALRVSLPALGNEFSSVIKDTSLLTIIGWMELSGSAFVQVSYAYRVYLYGTIVVWVEAAMLYFVLTYIVNRIVRALEDVSKVPGLEAAPQ